MSISELPSGSFRTQLRRKHFPIFDEVHPTRAAAVAAEVAELARRQGTVTHGPNMPLHAAIAQYQASAQYGTLADSTVRGYKRALSVVSEHLGEYTLEFLSRNVRTITAYRDKRSNSISKRTGKKIGPDAVRIEIAALSQVYDWAIESQLFSHNPLAGVKRHKAPRRKRRLHPDESVNFKLLAERGDDPAHRTFARFALTQLELYCRPGELAALRVADIDLRQRDCKFRDTKNGDDRSVHLSAAAVELISAQLVEAAVSNSPYLFHTVSKAGELVAYNYAWQVRVFRKLKYLQKGYKQHAIRKEALSRGLESDVPIQVLQLMSGHSSLQAVEDYRVDLIMSESARECVDEQSARYLLEADADVNNQLPPALALARAKHMFAALPPEIQKQFLASHLVSI